MNSKLLTGIKIILFFLMMVGTLYVHNEYYAKASTLPTGIIKEAVREGELETTKGSSATEKFKNLVEKAIIPNVKHAFIAISIIILLYYVFQFIIATSTEDIEKQKTNLLWAAVGFGLIGISIKIVEIIAPGQGQNIKEIGSREGTDNVIQMIIIFIQYLAGGVAFFFMIIAAIRIIVSQGIEEEINKQKKNFTWGALGLMVVMLSRAAVEALYNRSIGTETVQPGNLGEEGSREIYGIIQYVLQYLGIASVLALIAAGVFYVTSFGDDEKVAKAKKIIFATIIGIIIIYSSYSIVAYVARPAVGTLK